MSKEKEKKALFVSPCYCRSSWCPYCRTSVFTSRVHPIVKELRSFFRQLRHVTYTYNRENYPEFRESGFTPELYDRVDRDFINGQKKLIKYLGPRLLGYIGFVEFQSDEFVHYHVIYLMKESGFKAMIGESNLHKYSDGEFINRIPEPVINWADIDIQDMILKEIPEEVYPAIFFQMTHATRTTKYKSNNECRKNSTKK